MKYIKLSALLLGLQSASLNAQIRYGGDAAQQHSERIRKALQGTSFHGNSTYYKALVEETGKTLLQKSEINALHNEDNKLTAVIHIGPMKTGSSSIQASFHTVIGTPDEADYYEDASMAMDKELGIWNMIGCFRDPEASVDDFIVCKPETLSSVHQVAARKHNLVVSAEYLTSPDTNVGALKDFLEPWTNHKVVAYYRRYFDWLNSFHNQGNKKRSTPDRHSLVDFLQNERRSQFWWDKMYLIESMKRWGEHFTDFEIFNIHEMEDSDVRDSFFCKALPGASNACSKFRTKKAMDQSTDDNAAPTNPSVSFAYEDLAYYAKEMSLWSEEKSGLSFKEVSVRAQKHQETDLKLTAYDFGSALECPDDETAQFLLQRTLDAERQLFPTYFAERGEQEIRTEFGIQIKTKLCHVHAKKVLEDSSEWRQFFQSLNDKPNLRKMSR